MTGWVEVHRVQVTEIFMANGVYEVCYNDFYSLTYARDVSHNEISDNLSGSPADDADL